MKIKKTEDTLIAQRVPPYDRWSLIDENEEILYLSLTEVMEAYFQKTGFDGCFKIYPKKGELYISYLVETDYEKEEDEKYKIQYSIYGDYKA